MNDTQTEYSQKPVEPAQPTGIARRRLLRAGLAAAPVVLTLTGRSAMAENGSVSGSTPGCSQSPERCTSVASGPAPNTGSSPSTWQANLDSVDADVTFGAISGSGSDTRTLKSILAGEPNSLDAHFSAAYLNAMKDPDCYAINVGELSSLYTQRKLGTVTLSGDQIMGYLSQTWLNA